MRDPASGFAAGQILVRNRVGRALPPLPTTYLRGALRAPLDRGNPRRRDVRVTVRDKAGTS